MEERGEMGRVEGEDGCRRDKTCCLSVHGRMRVFRL